MPSVRLPIFGETQTQAGGVGETQPPAIPAGAGGAAAPAADEDGFGEEDLFGSGSEGAEDDRPPPAPAAAAPASASTGANSEPLAAEAADDLFGSEPGDELDERALFGSDDEGAELDERALFGSEDEGDDGAKKLPPKSPGAMSELSEMDEREIFGDVSEEEEPEKVEDVVLRRRPAPTDDRHFVSMRLPNVLSIERTPFNPESIPQTLLEGFKGFKTTMNKFTSRLLNPENCVRWRFRKGPDGHSMTDDDGRPLYESNSRIVEWEDGTKTLFVGAEAFDITEIDDRIVLFEENSQDVHVCHGTAQTRFVVTPRDLESTTHEMLKRTQYHKFEAIRRSLLMSQEEQDAHQVLLEIQADQKQRQRKDDQRKRALEPDAAVMSRAYLEDLEDDGGVGPSMKDAKDGAKRQRTA